MVALFMGANKVMFKTGHNSLVCLLLFLDFVIDALEYGFGLIDFFFQYFELRLLPCQILDICSSERNEWTVFDC